MDVCFGSGTLLYLCRVGDPLLSVGSGTLLFCDPQASWELLGLLLCRVGDPLVVWLFRVGDPLEMYEE